MDKPNAGTPAWQDYGPAEFDSRLMPRGHKRPAPDQGALFIAAVPPVRKPAAAPVQLPGQGELDLFDGEATL